MLYKIDTLRMTKQVYHNYEVCATNNILREGENLYKKFEELLEKHHKTAYQVSKDTGIAQSIFSEWKSGRIRILGANKLKVLADYFEVSIEYFLD